jgi:hypothetical protein
VASGLRSCPEIRAGVVPYATPTGSRETPAAPPQGVVLLLCRATAASRAAPLHCSSAAARPSAAVLPRAVLFTLLTVFGPHMYSASICCCYTLKLTSSSGPATSCWTNERPSCPRITCRRVPFVRSHYLLAIFHLIVLVCDVSFFSFEIAPASKEIKKRVC